MTRLLVLPLAFFAFVFGILSTTHERASAHHVIGAHCTVDSRGHINVSENDYISCDLTGETLNLYMRRDSAWRDRCNHYGGRPDTRRKSNGAIVRICHDIDY